MENNTNSTEKDTISLIEDLKQFDNNKGYKLSYGEVKKRLSDIIKNFIEQGEKCIEYLHPLLEHEKTWSCTFALEIMKEIKSEKSIKPLINFIKNNENGDYWECCDDALSALVSIGEPAIKPLLSEVKSNFQNKEYYAYLVGALTGIKHDTIYAFMADILNDYIENTEKYDGWLEIDHFTYDFSVQQKKEILPLLEKLASMNHLSEHEQMEIKSTIEAIEDPEKSGKDIEEMKKGFEKIEKLKKESINEKELLEQAIDFEAKKDYDNALDCITRILTVYPKSYHALFLDARINRKLGKPKVFVLSEAIEQAKKQKASQEVFEVMEEERKKISELYNELQLTTDEELELNFKCLNCSKRQNLKPGLIWEIEDSGRFLFEKEIMCKYCFSHNVELTKEGKMQITGQKMRLWWGESGGVANIGKKVMVEDKKIGLDDVYPYLMRRIKEKPLDGELCLRAGNSARKFNKYDDAIMHYKKAIELNPKLIAVYVNFVGIFKYRHKYYEIKEAKDEAILYLKKLRSLYDSQDYDSATLSHFDSLIEFIREQEIEFELSTKFKKVKDEDIKATIKNASTHNTDSVSQNIKGLINISKQEAMKLLEENSGVIVFQSYQIFDEKTNESKRLQLSSIMPIDVSKLCICGSKNYLKDCCLDKIKRKEPFVANIDYATYSLFKPIESKIKTNDNYTELVGSFQDDQRFYCEEETKNSALFIYYGNLFFTDEKLGTVIFGTIKIKKIFDNKAGIEIEALSKNRFDALNFAVREHLEE